MTTANKDEVHNMLFGIKRSVRYHMHRRRFYDNFHDISTALTVILGIGAAYTVIGTTFSPNVVALIAACISVLGVIDLVIGTTRKAREHNTFANKFSDLEESLTASPKSIKKIELARIGVEKEEPPVLIVLDVICHNEVMTAMGYKKEELVKIGWFQRLVSPLFDFRPHTLSP